jgi:serine/threonine-protein kinase
MGSVWRAWQNDLSRPVAVKTLRTDLCRDARLREMFVREAHILARLDHPGIVPVYSSGTTEQVPYYVMRLVEGTRVDRYLEGKPAAEVADVFRGVAQALATAHKANVLHRDVKPDNVLVEATGRAVLVDFGLSTRSIPGMQCSAEEVIVGTPDYLAPELLSGAGASPASDVYALGVTLYTTLAGRVPFPIEDLSAKLHAIRTDDPPLPRTLRADVPKPLQAICLKAMERAPADRYASADEFARDLDRFAKGDIVRALPVRSRSLLRRKIELHLTELADWSEQGLLDDAQWKNLRYAYEHIDERERGLLRGVLSSIPNLLLLIGILLSVFGPVLLQALTWDAQDEWVRLALPAIPLALLSGVGARRWRLQDRRRAVACLMGSALLVAPLAFALADLVPDLRSVVDARGVSHSVRPGELWLPERRAPSWMLEGAKLLEWKLLLTASANLVASVMLYRRTRAAAFLWIAALAGIGATMLAALVAGWRDLPLATRWLLAILGSLGTIGLGLGFDKSFRRDRAFPFYALGFSALIVAALVYSDENMPMSLAGVTDSHVGAPWSSVFHALAFTAGGIVVCERGALLVRQGAGAVLCSGFLLMINGLVQLVLDSRRSTLCEVLLVAACVGYLILGLIVHRNSLVLLAAIALPIAVGAVSQRHLRALWAWSGAVVIGGAALVVLSFSISSQRGRARSMQRESTA